MPYCPECKAGYRDGYTVCSDCGIPLVEHTPEPKEPDMHGDQSAYEEKRTEPTFLLATSDGMETEMLMALLRNNGIPAMARPRGSGEFLRVYMGMSFQPVDIYVPAAAVEDASALVRDTMVKYGEAGCLEDENAPDTDDDFSREIWQEAKRRRRLKVWLIILLFVPGLLWALIALLIELLG